MKWLRVIADEWVLLVPERGEVARIRRVSDNEYMLVTLPGTLRCHASLDAAKHSGSKVWRDTENYYEASLHTMRAQLPLPGNE